MKFDPIPRKNIFGEGCFIKSPENLLYFTEEFELAGVNWGAPAGISAPYFLRLLQEGKNLAYETMSNTARLYGYTSVEDAEAKLEK